MMRSIKITDRKGNGTGIAIPVMMILIIPMILSTAITAEGSNFIMDAPTRESISPWSSLGGGPMNNYRVDANFSGLMPRIAWEISLEAVADSDSAAVLDNEHNIIFSLGDAIYKFGPDGSEIWKTELEDQNTDSLDPSVPAIDSSGNIYTVLRNGTMLSLDRNGSTRWHFVLKDGGFDTVNGPPICRNDVVYYSGSTNMVRALASNGTQLWDHPLDNRYNNAVSVSMSGDVAVTVMGPGGSLIMLNRTGNLLWEVDYPDHDVETTPAFDDDGNVYISLNRQDESVIHSYHPNGSLRYESVSFGAISHYYGNVQNGIAVMENGDLILTQLNGMIARMRGNGMILWERDYGGSDTSSTAVVSRDGTIIAPLVDHVLIIDPDGSIRSIIEAKAQVRTISFDRNGSGYMMDGLDGVITRIDMIPNPPPEPLDDPPDIEFFEDDHLILNWTDIISDDWTDPIEVSVESDGGVLSMDNDPLSFWKMTAEENYTGTLSARFIISDTGPDLIPGNSDDSLVIGKWFNVSVIPVNDPPVIEDLGDLVLLSGMTHRIPINATDIDSDEMHLTYTVNSPVSWIYMKGRNLILEPPDDVDFEVGLDVIIIDGSMGESVIEITVSFVIPNRPPVFDIRHGSILVMDEDTGTQFSIGSIHRGNDIEISDPDGDYLTYHFSAGRHVDVIHSGRDVFELRTEENWNGYTHVLLNVTDGYHEMEYLVNISVHGVDDPVEDLRIVPYSDISSVDNGTIISLFADYHDPDEDIDPMSIRHNSVSWSSNISGHLDDGLYLNTSLAPGYHTIEVMVRDSWSYGEERFALIEIYVDEDGYAEDGGPEYTGDEDIEGIGTAVIIAGLFYLLILLFPVIAVITHRVLLRRSGLIGRPESRSVDVSGKTEIEENGGEVF